MCISVKIPEVMSIFIPIIGKDFLRNTYWGKFKRLAIKRISQMQSRTALYRTLSPLSSISPHLFDLFLDLSFITSANASLMAWKCCNFYVLGWRRVLQSLALRFWQLSDCQDVHKHFHILPPLSCSFITDCNRCSLSRFDTYLFSQVKLTPGLDLLQANDRSNLALKRQKGFENAPLGSGQ